MIPATRNIITAVRLVTGLFCFIPLATLAQESKPVYGFGAAAHGGWIWAHTPKMNHLITGYMPSYEVSVSKRSDGSKQWQRFYNLPDYGLSFLVQDFRNPLLGHSFSLLPYIDFVIIKKKKFELNLRSSAGPVWLTKPFDADNNFTNIAIGSHINSVIQYAGICRFSLSERVKFDAGLTFTHFSNGANRFPNLGMNVPTLRLGLSWFTGEAYNIQALRTKEDSAYRPVNELMVFTAFGLKGVEAGDPKRLPVYTLSLQWLKPFSYKTGIMVGKDIFYSMLIARGYMFDSDSLRPGRDALRSGISAFFVHSAGALSYHYGMGVYVWAPYKGNGLFYHRIGLRYRITPSISAGFTLKTHFAVADNLEFGLVWKIK